MKKQDETVVIGFVVESDHIVTLTEVRQRFAIDDHMLNEMIEHGLIELQQLPTTTAIRLDQEALRRIQTALHLYHDLGVNISGSALILEMLDEMAVMRHELAILRRHLG